MDGLLFSNNNNNINLYTHTHTHNKKLIKRSSYFFTLNHIKLAPTWLINMFKNFLRCIKFQLNSIDIPSLSAEHLKVGRAELFKQIPSFQVGAQSKYLFEIITKCILIQFHALEPFLIFFFYCYFNFCD